MQIWDYAIAIILVHLPTRNDSGLMYITRILIWFRFICLCKFKDDTAHNDLIVRSSFICSFDFFKMNRLKKFD